MQTKEKGQARVALSFLQKLKGIKNIEMVLACVLGAIILLIYFSNFTSNSSTTTTTSSSTYMSSLEYASVLEEKLSKTLSSIAGAGQVQVMVTLESGPELVIATSTDKKTNTTESGSTKTSSVTVVENPVIVTQNGVSSPLILMEVLPKVQGVIIISQGAQNIKVKLDLLNAIQALLDISSNNIQIFDGN